MKTATLFIIVIGLIVVCIGCPSNRSSSVSANRLKNSNTNQSSDVNQRANKSPESTPELTYEQYFRARRIQELQSLWKDIDDYDKAFTKPVTLREKITGNTNKSVCDLYAPYVNAVELSEYETDNNYNVQINEIAPELTKEKILALKKARAKDLILGLKAVSADAFLLKPCEINDLRNYLEVVERMISALEEGGFKLEDFDFTPTNLRDRLLKGYLQMADFYKSNTDPQKRLEFPVTGQTTIGHELKDAMKEDGFTAKELGLSAEQEAEIRDL